MGSAWGRAFIGALCELDGFVMRGLTGLFSWSRGHTNILFERPGLGIVRQYKNDGEKENNVPHLLIS